MTVIQSSHTFRSVLDISGTHHSKNRIRKALRALEIRTIEHDVDGRCFQIHNYIKVGMYLVYIITTPQEESLKLKDLSALLISIHEVRGKLPIRLDQDGRFKRQYWVQDSINGTLKVKHLVDVVAHCQRLDGLKAFL